MLTDECTESPLRNRALALHLEGCQHNKAWLRLNEYALSRGRIGVPTLLELVEYVLDKAKLADRLAESQR